ncbi:MucR family transcriptional regulator [Methylobacterium sp.]|uniref:MucR family transcriptional regulator n=1 Tax=Methylobacterium sp. TaxID=409 RepID=UPI00345461EE
MDEELKVEQGTSVGLVDLMVGIITAYVAHNSVPPSDLPALIARTYEALCRQPHAGVASRMAANAAPASMRLTLTQIRASITPDALISFEDGRPYKTLKRHLTGVGLTPDTYRAKWGLPPPPRLPNGGSQLFREALRPRSKLRPG